MIRLFDCQTGFGGGRPGLRQLSLAEDWFREMDRLRIAQALVRIVPEELNRDAIASNGDLLEFCRTNDRLTPCPIVLPAGGGDVPAETEQIESLLTVGAGAAWLRPNHDHWSLHEWCGGPLLGTLAEARLPAYVLERHVALENLADLAERRPDLPIILAEVNYRSQRKLRPFLQSFPNVHLSLGAPYTVHRGVEQLVQTIGPERLLFGTGYPLADPGMAITQLLYAELSDDDKVLTGSGNMDRLLREVRR